VTPAICSKVLRFKVGKGDLLLASLAVLCSFARRILIAKAQRTAKKAKGQATLPNLDMRLNLING